MAVEQSAIAPPSPPPPNLFPLPLFGPAPWSSACLRGRCRIARAPRPSPRAPRPRVSRPLCISSRRVAPLCARFSTFRFAVRPLRARRRDAASRSRPPTRRAPRAPSASARAARGPPRHGLPHRCPPARPGTASLSTADPLTRPSILPSILPRRFSPGVLGTPDPHPGRPANRAADRPRRAAM